MGIAAVRDSVTHALFENLTLLFQPSKSPSQASYREKPPQRAKQRAPAYASSTALRQPFSCAVVAWSSVDSNAAGPAVSCATSGATPSMWRNIAASFWCASRRMRRLSLRAHPKWMTPRSRFAASTIASMVGAAAAQSLTANRCWSEQARRAVM